MTGLAPLIITPEVTDAFTALRDLAAANPVNIQKLAEVIKHEAGRLAHRDQMQNQSLLIDTGPFNFVVVFSVETHHPCGTCRHLSVSIVRDGRVPSPEAVQLIAEYLGFEGGITDCTIYPEKLSDGATAINIVQPVALVKGSSGPGKVRVH
jgi:hypothetical protein